MIGVLGGMGPKATADFLMKLVDATPVNGDADHIPVVALSHPQIPDRSRAIIDGGPSPLPELISMAKILKLAGADFGVIPCNTAHHWYNDLDDHSELEFLHIVDAVCQALKDRNTDQGCVGLMATPGTIKSGFYQYRLAELGYQCHIPDEASMVRIQHGIANVKANDLKTGHQILMQEAKLLQDRNITTIILGCTELPLVLSDPELFIDSSQALAEACVLKANKSRTSTPLALIQEIGHASKIAQSELMITDLSRALCVTPIAGEACEALMVRLSKVDFTLPVSPIGEFIHYTWAASILGYLRTWALGLGYRVAGDHK